MPAVARGNEVDQVHSETGSGPGCGSPMTTATEGCSPDVFVNGYGVVRQGDGVKPHTSGGCGTDSSVLTTCSSTVFVNGKGVGRIGDQYTDDNTITTGSPNVFCGG
jgi:uncharacterized Zn-binding protein involved in type VI secretion